MRRVQCIYFINFFQQKFPGRGHEKRPYSLATNGSNDNGLKKMNPLTVQIYDVNLKQVKTSFLDVCL